MLIMSNYVYWKNSMNMSIIQKHEENLIVERNYFKLIKTS